MLTVRRIPDRSGAGLDGIDLSHRRELARFRLNRDAANGKPAQTQQGNKRYKSHHGFLFHANGGSPTDPHAPSNIAIGSDKTPFPVDL
jgi:hypothetical protein